jgi:hypothetical protein
LEVFVYLVIANILWLPFWVDVEGHGVFGGGGGAFLAASSDAEGCADWA